jgi:hypothetical protein
LARSRSRIESFGIPIRICCFAPDGNPRMQEAAPPLPRSMPVSGLSGLIRRTPPVSPFSWHNLLMPLCVLNFSRRCRVTTDATSPVAADAHESRAAEAKSMSKSMVLLWTFIVFPLGYNDAIHSTALQVIFLLARSAPFVILCTIVLRRRFFHAPLPARWPEEAPILSQLNRLESIGWVSLFLYIIAAIITNIVFGRHSSSYALLHEAFWTLIGWSLLLQSYIEDHKPLPPAPPPTPPYDPSKSWATTMKPLHSDQWGQTADR